jgi:superfamily II DNA helicase RecQ
MAVTSVSMLLLSPEQLTSRSFDHLLQKKAFSERIAALGLDEMHLVMDWGNPGFREAFRHIGLVLARLPRSTTFIGATATLLRHQTSPLFSILGLKPGTFFFNRRSNLRTDVHLIFRVLRHGLGGWYFPDLKWIVEGDRKTVIYCDTISLAFRLLVYLWHCSPLDRCNS